MARGRWGKTGLAVLALVLIAPQVRGDDEPAIEVELGAREIFLGESADYVVEIRNVNDPAAPDMGALRALFDVVPNGDDSRNVSSVSVIDGRVRKQTILSHFYRYRLTPKRAGRLSIPAPVATIGGKTISGRVLTLNVVAPEEQDLVIPELKADRLKVYPTQPLEVELRVLVRPLPDDPDRDPLSPLRQKPPHIEVNWVDLPTGFTGIDKARWLQKLLSENDTGFTLNDITLRSGFLFGGPRPAVFSLPQGRESRNGRDGLEVNYYVYTLKRTLIPEKIGTYTLGPAVVKGTFAEGKEVGGYTGRRLVATAPPLTVEVRDVPADRPATFCGGIGSFRVGATASPTALRVGDPLTLRVDIERGQGSGSLDLISAPNLEANAKLAADFEIVDKNPTGKIEGDVKRFEYALRPKRAAVGVPAVSLSIFNPDKEVFSEITSEPIALSVSEASQLGAGELIGALGGAGKEDIKAQAAGIFGNVTDPSELFDQRVNVVALAGGAAGTWCVVGCLMAFVAAQRRRSGDLLGQRKRNARRAANGKLAAARRALAEGDSRLALRSVRSALVGLVADLRNIVAEGLTASEADAALAEAAVAPEQRKALADLLAVIESAEYGSGVATEAPAMIKTAEKLIQSLARQLERNGARV